jgi:peroxiredoxin Q/BCP
MAWHYQAYSPTKGCFMTKETVKLKPKNPSPKKGTSGNYEETIIKLNPIELEMMLPNSFEVQKIRFGQGTGRWQVVFIYPKDNTSGCTQEAIDFSILKPEFDALKCDLVGLSKDGLKSHQKFIQSQSLTLNLVSDPETILISALGSWVEKSLYGRAYMGADRSTFVINPQGDVVGAWRKVKVPNHANEVLAQLKTILA